jgi:exodeoxyribonuclease V alpha subunit
VVATEFAPPFCRLTRQRGNREAKNIMTWMGQHATTRTGPRGAQVATPVQRLEAVTVRHYTNRAGDPQRHLQQHLHRHRHLHLHLHLHLQVNARVQANGKWCGIDTVEARDSIDAVHGIAHATVVADPQFRQALADHGFTLDEAGEIVQRGHAASGRVVGVRDKARGWSGPTP